MYDLIIIGAGPAGITAAVYAARKKMNVLVITKDIGGQAAWSGDIENYTGYQFITGPELAAKFEEHMRKFSINVKESEEVLSIQKNHEHISLKTTKAAYEAKAVIIASGKRSKELGVTGEQEFKNKGLTYCATCDGPLFAGKDVAVIGGGNSALDATLQLIAIAKQVYLITIDAQLHGDEVMKEKVIGSDKVSVVTEAHITAITGTKFVDGLELKKGTEKQKLPVQGIFIEIGLIPNSEFAQHVEKNEKGEIKINSYNQTNISGVFAAGDVTDIPEKQIVIAAGEGSKATLSVFRYLSKQRSDLWTS